MQHLHPKNHVCKVCVGEVFAAGFQCKDVSLLNPNRALHQSCIKNGVGKTGGTFGAAFQRVKNHGPCVILLENVRGLKGKNLKRCLQMLRLAGYIVIVVTNCCSNHALAARRNRVWIVGVLSSHQLDTRSTVALQNTANWLEQDLRHLGPRLDECLLEMDMGSVMVRQTLEKKAATQ